MENKVIINEFMRFLDEHDARKLWIFNFRNCKESCKPNRIFEKQPVTWISGAFRWSMTPEGLKFWKSLNTKWEITALSIMNEKKKQETEVGL